MKIAPAWFWSLLATCVGTAVLCSAWGAQLGGALAVAILLGAIAIEELRP